MRILLGVALILSCFAAELPLVADDCSQNEGLHLLQARTNKTAARMISVTLLGIDLFAVSEPGLSCQPALSRLVE